GSLLSLLKRSLAFGGFLYPLLSGNNFPDLGMSMDGHVVGRIQVHVAVVERNGAGLDKLAHELTYRIVVRLVLGPCRHELLGLPFLGGSRILTIQSLFAFDILNFRVNLWRNRNVIRLWVRTLSAL